MGEGINPQPHEEESSITKVPDPFSGRHTERVRWLESLPVPVIDSTEKKLVLGKPIGAGRTAKVSTAILDGKPVVLKYLRHTVSGRTFDQEQRERLLRGAFAWMFLVNKLFPKNCPKPIAQLNFRGRPSGLIMEAVSGIPLVDKIDELSTERAWQANPYAHFVYRQGQNPPKAIFLEKLKTIATKLYQKNLSLSDPSPENIIVESETEQPVLIDQEYNLYRPTKEKLTETLRRIDMLSN